MEDLSRGMQQKVALARALLTSPRCCCSTSRRPGSTRAPSSRCRVHPRGAAAQDTTTLLCTHDMVEAETLADRVGILDGGRLLALETSTALRRRYRAETLEDAFMAATGKTFADEPEEEAA